MDERGVWWCTDHHYKGIRCGEVTCKIKDVCFKKIGKSDNKFEWLVGNKYMNCKRVRKDILRLEYIKEVVWRAMEYD